MAVAVKNGEAAAAVTREMVRGKDDLPQVILTLRPKGGLPGSLHGGEQQAGKHGHDGEDDQQFDERKGSPHRNPPLYFRGQWQSRVTGALAKRRSEPCGRRPYGAVTMMLLAI